MTNPTAEAAKLLPSEAEIKWLVSMQGTIEAGKVIEQLYGLAKENTRPQPTPPAGEPDFAALACQIGFEDDEEWSELEISYGGGGRNINRHRLIEIIETLAEKMYRLGLAARPTVEDAEVAKSLETIANGIARALEAAESKLAEREAELEHAALGLAEAYWLLSGAKISCMGEEWLKRHQKWLDENAARQQQKEPK